MLERQKPAPRQLDRSLVRKVLVLEILNISAVLNRVTAMLLALRSHMSGAGFGNTG